MRRRRPPRFGFLPQIPCGSLLTSHDRGSELGSSASTNDLESGITLVNLRHPSDKSEGETLQGRVKRKRNDMPIVRHVDKGDAERAVSACESAATKQSALDSLLNDMYATTSKKPRDALLKTWVRLHTCWFGDEESSPAFPLDEIKLVRVSALFKSGGYKSFKNYLSRAKDQHLALGFGWSESLNRVAQKCTRSVTRGLANAKRSEAFDLPAVTKALEENQIEPSSDGPRHPRAMVITATYFMLRELEASAIDRDDVMFSSDSVTLSLPVSKTDWEAKGCTRSWSCLCDRGLPCPFHTLLQHCDLLDSQGYASDSPLFPSHGGGYCTKAGVVRMIRLAAQMAGMEMQSADGVYRLSGHTFRITGARYLSAAGLDPITIQLLGRWGSNAVLTYLAEAPLMSMNHRIKSLDSQRLDRATADTRPNFQEIDRRADVRAMLDDREQLKLRMKSLEDKISNISQQMEQHADEMQGVSVVLENFGQETWRVINTRSCVEHCAQVRLSSSPHTWRTRCGWAFSGKKNAETFNETASLIHAYKKCPKCHQADSSDESSSAHSASDSDG